MDILLQIALIILPAGAVLLTTIFFLRKEAAKDVQDMRAELKKQRQEYFLPSRVEAYQRAVLLMERIHPNSLVMRLDDSSEFIQEIPTRFIPTEDGRRQLIITIYTINDTNE